MICNQISYQLDYRCGNSYEGPKILLGHHHHHECSAQEQVLHCKLRNSGCSSAQRQVFHRKLRNPRLQFYQGWIDAVASRCFPHPTPSLASEQSLKDLRRSQGHQRGGEEWIWLNGPSGLNRNLPQGLDIDSIRVFDQIRDPEIPVNLHPYIDTQTHKHAGALLGQFYKSSFSARQKQN